jgi:hypothetical protein
MPLTLAEESDLQSILDESIAVIDRLTAWEKGFVTDIQERYEEQGAAIIVTGKMWLHLRRIEEKVNAL